MLPLEQVSPAASFVLMLNLLFSLIFLPASFVAIVSLVLNIPLFRKAGRESARLRELGLSYFSHSLLKESRRGRWINRLRGVLFIGALIYMVLDAVLFFIKEGMLGGGLVTFIVLYVIAAFGSLIAARYLRNQRERMELAASAEELRNSFQNLRKRSETGVVSVPAELLKKTATIETAQIAEERKDAIFESVSSRPTGYAIAFDRDAIKQRTMLDVADRIELADLVAQLSIAGIKLEPREGMQGDKTKGNRVEIDYVIDNASRSIRVTAVRRQGKSPNASVSGASHA